jgi:hypothetical protein
LEISKTSEDFFGFERRTSGSKPTPYTWKIQQVNLKTILKSSRSILDTQGEQELYVRMDRASLLITSYGCSGTGTVPLGQQRLYLLEQTSHSAVKS